jgi:hypothetical protein
MWPAPSALASEAAPGGQEPSRGVDLRHALVLKPPGPARTDLPNTLRRVSVRGNEYERMSLQHSLTREASSYKHPSPAT